MKMTVEQAQKEFDRLLAQAMESGRWSDWSDVAVAETRLRHLRQVDAKRVAQKFIDTMLGLNGGSGS